MTLQGSSPGGNEFVRRPVTLHRLEEVAKEALIPSAVSDRAVRHPQVLGSSTSVGKNPDLAPLERAHKLAPRPADCDRA